MYMHTNRHTCIQCALTHTHTHTHTHTRVHTHTHTHIAQNEIGITRGAVMNSQSLWSPQTLTIHNRLNSEKPVLPQGERHTIIRTFPSPSQTAVPGYHSIHGSLWCSVYNSHTTTLLYTPPPPIIHTPTPHIWYSCL